ncbi:MAG: FAD-dependent oxidoreductase [Pseudomonadota bacterium]
MTAGDQTIIVVGAGICGLACARRLVERGLAPVVLDKGRAAGGRVASRRTAEGYRFDHGAQYFTVRDSGFRIAVEQALEHRAAGLWHDGSGRQRYVGIEGMSGFARFLAAGLDVRTGTQVSSIEKDGSCWKLEMPDGAMTAERVVLTLPAPQTAVLLGIDHAFAEALQCVEFDPCLTLMVATDGSVLPDFIHSSRADSDLAWLARDSSKPGRNTSGCWVAQASPDWSARHLEMEKAEIPARMLPLFCRALGCNEDKIRHAEGHRWRYARVAKPLNRLFLRDDDATLYAGGDWCLEARVEAAWKSGRAIADDMVATV